MLHTNAYDIRLARPVDAASIRWLSEIDMRPMPRGRVLVADVDGQAAAAISLDDGSVVANPMIRTAHLVTALRSQARAHGARERKPSLRERLLDGLRRPVVA